MPVKSNIEFSSGSLYFNGEGPVAIRECEGTYVEEYIDDYVDETCDIRT